MAVLNQKTTIDQKLQPSVPGQTGKYGGINPGGDMYAGGSKNFNEQTGQIDKLAANSAKGPSPLNPQQTGGDTMYAGGSSSFDESTGKYNPLMTSGAEVSPAKPATGTQYEQSTGYNVPGASDTVEGRLTGLLSKDSDYMKRAETKGLQAAASRGILNTSMAAGAAQASAIDAALPIAQQDADWSNRNRMQSDVMANERALKQYEQENLAWSQFLKGIADINMQDLDPTAKQQAIQNLRDNYFAGSGIAASLRGASVQNGQFTYAQPEDGATSAQSGTQTPGTQAPSSGQANTSNVNNPSDLLSYESKDAMDATQRYVFEQQFGKDAQPSEVKKVNDMYTWVKEKYQKQGVEDPSSNLKYASQFKKDLDKKLQESGFDIKKDRAKIDAIYAGLGIKLPTKMVLGGGINA